MDLYLFIGLTILQGLRHFHYRFGTNYRLNCVVLSLDVFERFSFPVKLDESITQTLLVLFTILKQAGKKLNREINFKHFFL